LALMEHGGSFGFGGGPVALGGVRTPGGGSAAATNTRLRRLAQGPWAPRKIPNPAYYNDEEPLKHIGEVGAVAIEVWTMDSGYFFDDVLVASDPADAAAFAAETFEPKKKLEVRWGAAFVCVLGGGEFGLSVCLPISPEIW
jgi:Calreticulin family